MRGQAYINSEILRESTLAATGRFRSGQTGQTVNLLAYAFAGSNPALPILIADLARVWCARK
jgi:hypothetical protein